MAARPCDLWLGPGWADHVDRSTRDSVAFVVGVITSEGQRVAGNRGFRQLFTIRDGERDGAVASAAERFINPTLAALCAREPDARGLVFEGLLTVGDLYTQRTLEARVIRRGHELLLIAEQDVLELDRLNKSLSALNGEVNNLQRELIKEKHQLEATLAELRETQAMLVHAEKMSALGQLVAGVAHEVNNPIAYVNSNIHSLAGTVAELREAYETLERLISERGDDELRALAAQTRERADVEFLFEDLVDMRGSCLTGLARVKQIVENLRTFSRLDEARLKHVELAAAIRSTVEVATLDLKKRGIAIELQLAKMPLIECYSAELNQVLLNLLLNAAQASAPGTTVTIRAALVDGLATIEIEDQGEGIAADVLPRIFDPFFTTKPVGAGTGLGLSISYEIVENHHGGHLSVRSEVGRGTTFTIQIPTAQTEETDA